MSRISPGTLGIRVRDVSATAIVAVVTNIDEIDLVIVQRYVNKALSKGLFPASAFEDAKAVLSRIYLIPWELIEFDVEEALVLARPRASPAPAARRIAAQPPKTATLPGEAKLF